MDLLETTDELELALGEAIRRIRLQRNLPRDVLASQAGVSLAALKNLETGKGVTTRTLLGVVRALGKADWVASLAPPTSVNPLHMVKGRPQRQRASRGAPRGDAQG